MSKFKKGDIVEHLAGTHKVKVANPGTGNGNFSGEIIEIRPSKSKLGLALGEFSEKWIESFFSLYQQPAGEGSLAPEQKPKFIKGDIVECKNKRYHVEVTDCKELENTFGGVVVWSCDPDVKIGHSSVLWAKEAFEIFSSISTVTAFLEVRNHLKEEIKNLKQDCADLVLQNKNLASRNALLLQSIEKFKMIARDKQDELDKIFDEMQGHREKAERLIDENSQLKAELRKLRGEHSRIEGWYLVEYTGVAGDFSMRYWDGKWFSDLYGDRDLESDFRWIAPTPLDLEALYRTYTVTD